MTWIEICVDRGRTAELNDMLGIAGLRQIDLWDLVLIARPSLNMHPNRVRYTP